MGSKPKICLIVTLLWIGSWQSAALGDESAERCAAAWESRAGEPTAQRDLPRYRSQNEVPHLGPPGKPVRVLYYSDSKHGAESVGIALEAIKTNNDSVRKFEYEVVDASQFKDKEAFLKHVQENSASADVVLFHGHSNPTAYDAAEAVELTAADFKKLDLSGKHIVFAGCNSGVCEWRPDLLANPRSPLAGTEIDRRDRLLESVMENTGAKSVTGTLWMSDGPRALKILKALLAREATPAIVRLEAHPFSRSLVRID